MEKILGRFKTFDEAREAEFKYYRKLPANEKLQISLELIVPENPYAAIVERSARVPPLTEHKEC